MKLFIICRIRCLRCGDVLEQNNAAKTDRYGKMLWCGCGRVGLDPAAVGYRIVGDPNDYVDLSEEWPDERYEKLEQVLRDLYINIWTIYPPAGDDYFGDCYFAAVDMFIPGITFRIWFKENEGQIEIVHIERWHFG